MDTLSAIQKAVDAVGSQAALAKAIGVPPALVWQWLNSRRPVAAQHCIPIEAATAGAVTRYDLRPDVFGPAPSATAAEVA
jgi:DNA-binding transcriptional regulator YdaS (Cro superfamily)